jgi:hypothetical protein
MTAVLTMVSLCVSYGLDALPEAPATVADDLLRRIIRAVFRIKDCRMVQSAQARTANRFEKLLMSLADQQLVTSLAILVATLIQRSTMSLYTLEMAEYCALVSLLTHMVNTRYCPRYLQQWPILGWMRTSLVILIMCGVTTLLYCTTVAEYKVDPIVAGLLQNEQSTNETAAALRWDVRPSCILQPGIPDSPDLIFSGILPAVFWSFALVTYYINILAKTFADGGSIHASSFYYRLICRALGEEYASFDNPTRRLEALRPIISRMRNDRLRRICERLLPLDLAYFALKASVSADMPWLMFVAVYSLFQVFEVWVDGDSPFWTWRLQTSGFGFGQTTALILLLLPLLALSDPLLSSGEPSLQQNFNAYGADQTCCLSSVAEASS